MRSYFAGIVGFDFSDPSKGSMLVSMGLSELGLSLFSETPELVSLRRHAQEDARLAEALGGRPGEAFPVLMQYNPLLTYVETVPGEEGRPRLVVSILGGAEDTVAPHNTRDEGQLLSYVSLQAASARV